MILAVAFLLVLLSDPVVGDIPVFRILSLSYCIMTASNSGCQSAENTSPSVEEEVVRELGE
ncbi:MAG: hypothetical protein ACI4QT_03445, partial [Kiritimatiellia bacterium]